MHSRLDALCVISSAVAQACADDESLASVPMYLTPECVPAALAGPNSTRRPEWLPNEPFALFVGALGPHKGLNTILDARRQLGYRLPLVVVGMSRHDTPDMADEPDLVVRYDAPHEEVMAAWSAATIGLAPSVWAEPLGLVAVEAQLSGCALIASNTGGLRDVVQDGQNGLLVPPGDVEALRSAMHRLWFDEALRAQLAERGVQTALAFTAPRVVDHLMAIYQDEADPIHD
jgi:glycosyltransferase involved in cell wall biosynthesis